MCQTTQLQRALEYARADRYCDYCQARIHGRRDKVFCDYQCKNRYHAVVRSTFKAENKEVTNKMITNYRALSELIGKNHRKVVKRRDLLKKNFDFGLCTGYKINQFGAMNYVFKFYWFERPNQQYEIRMDPSAPDIHPMIIRRWESEQRMKGLL